MEDNNAVAPLLVGLRFQPSDAMLLGYLFSKITGKSRLHLDQQVIKDFNLYGEKEPWEIWELYGGDNLRSGEDLYFFTQSKKKTQNSSKMNRLIGTGTWMITGPAEAITYSQLSAQPLGFKKRFRYKGEVAQQVSQWIMFEYSLDTNLVSMNDCNYVLCRLKKKDLKEEKG
ncbi:PREDICTED: NAC domain-containing protein 101 [Theobroma cacao]|uniref:NAC domain-containing protein 101 n=1 Tax=Theobroma cacao TaxID=3641 RepID=A0AB32X2V9_THECC|nr:PREDICTED: NAC domain-containing protein 101 [Theobroma cacao]